MENIVNAKKIRDRIPKKIKHRDRRNYLELVIKNHVLDMQNIELEINLQIQEKTINDLKNIIESQRKIIQENNLDNRQGEENVLSNNSNEEIDLDFDEMIYDDDYNEDNKSNNDPDEEDEDIQEMSMFREAIERHQ